MRGYRISDAARATGFSVSALRFYEKEGVVVPDRSESDYCVYSDHHLDALRFVRRGKQLGLSLDEIKELLELLADEDCDPVQSRIKELVGGRISQAQEQVAELVGFTSQLQDVQARLSSHTAEGPCDDQCGCRTDPVTHERREPEPIPLIGADSGDIACSLDPDLVGGRVEDWNRVFPCPHHALRSREECASISTTTWTSSSSPSLPPRSSTAVRFSGSTSG